MLRKQLDTKDKQIDLLLTQNQTLADTLHQTQEQLSAAQALHAGTIQQQLLQEESGNIGIFARIRSLFGN